jgi:hypothetical protein
MELSMSSVRSVSILGALLCTTSSLAGGSVSGTYLGYGANEQWGCAYKTSLTWDSTASVNYSNLRLSERLWDLGDGASTVTWCVQVYQGVTIGNSYAFDLVTMDMVPQTPPAPGPMGFAKAAIMSDVMSRWLDSDSRVIAAAGSTNARAAAFNAVVWEIVNENFVSTDLATIVSRMSLTTGAFRSTLGGEALAIYNAMVSSIGQGGYQSANTEGWLSATAQDQVRMVPTPGAIALVLLGGFIARRRR